MIRYALKYSAIIYLIPVILLSACRSKTLSRIPDDKEVYNYFLDQLKQTAKAGGYLKYRLAINKLQRDTISGDCTTPDHENVSCFTISIDRTEYLDNYTGTYTTTFTGDVYHLYRKPDGKLGEVDHVAGAQNTVQDHHPDTSNSL